MKNPTLKMTIIMITIIIEFLNLMMIIENCKLNTFNRVRYFTGQLLVPEDFTHEQNYFNSKRHLINKLVNGSGIVCGLKLQIVDQSSEAFTNSN